ncbi:MAG: hypothetical protein WBQ94_11440 [Terracidiphilus sp.]
MQYHVTNSQFLVGVFVLTLAFIFALAAYLEFRKRKAPKFRNYFAYEYDRNLRDESWSNNENVFATQHSPFAPFRLREFAASRQRIGSSIGVPPDSE